MNRLLLLVCLLVAPLMTASNNTSAAARRDNTCIPFDYVHDREAAKPATVTLRAAVLTNTVPLAFYDENITSRNSIEPFPSYRGFQPALMRHLITIAADFDNITLHWELEQAPPFSYAKQFEYMSVDCNSTSNRKGGFPLEDCNRLDLIVGDYYGYPSRSIKTLLTPPLLTTAAATVQYVHRAANKRQITTLREAVALQEPVCLLDESHFDDQATERFLGLLVERCYTHDECLLWLKEDRCALFVEDKLQLNYLAVKDPDLHVTRQTFDEQYIVWPLNARLDPQIQQLIIRWIYQAKVTGILDELYDEFFSIAFCPLGSSGVNCHLPCSTAHGLADRYGNCVCESTKWTGSDCTVMMEENTNLISTSLKIVSYIMVGINFTVVAICAFWLWINRNTTQVRVCQPIFLSLILIGCLISSSTIFALAAEDEGEQDVPGCMAIPWLYSVGFSITFGSLFAKIRRVYTLFRAAEHIEATAITTTETLSIVNGILLIDVVILTTWTVVDPLQWKRRITSMDKFGDPLSSEGYCHSDHWMVFAGIIAALHLGLMLLATGMCYMSRKIPTKFHEGKYLSIAMISNLQIFVIGLPVLVILGSDPQSSFFVRSAIIWMNDLVVVTVIFGNIMYSHHQESKSSTESTDEFIISKHTQTRAQGRWVYASHWGKWFAVGQDLGEKSLRGRLKRRRLSQTHASAFSNLLLPPLLTRASKV
ncbi:acid type B receptor subunit 2 [Seminavis robusta]|uniref:Acid type B receptor subunit 2 n=1 Tax=Seminavis robusta TaxID=568900 RepID=A0A9N8E2E4_9STRA|nr:acid type B receptor subunit 2 [Seminavis robusta]|eukprot:Sro488_g152980.1 acid type B receptor subunit 2 (707) ;mRNA; r:1752-4165